jgi:hypothetical protein
MFKNGANTAMDLKTFENSNSNVNSDVINIKTYNDCYRFRHKYNNYNRYH